MKDADTLLARTAEFAATLTAQRAEQQRRRSLDAEDFRSLREIGLHLAAIPTQFGGYWESTQASMHPLCGVWPKGPPSVHCSRGWSVPAASEF